MRCVTLRSLIAVAVLTVAVHTQAPDPADSVKDIQTYVDCLNKLNPAGKNVADGVRCLPRGCKITMTMSTQSAQAACRLGNCQLPRILLNCPGTGPQLRFRPSFSLCPTNSRGKHLAKDGTEIPGTVVGSDRVEIGQDKTKQTADKTGSMCMGDVELPVGTDFTKLTKDKVISERVDPPKPPKDPIKDQVTNGTKNCNSCHDTAGAGPGNEELSKSLHPFGRFQGTNLVPDVIYTEEGFRLAPRAPNKAQGFKDICDCIDKIDIAKLANEPPVPPADRNPAASKEVLQMLCRNLESYQKDRGCGKKNLADGTPVKCGAVRGGGKFLNGTSTSIFNFDLSGEAKRPDGTNFEFIDIDGDLSAYDYKTNTRVDNVVLTEVKGATMGNGDITVTAKGKAKVNGVDKDIVITITRVGGVLTYEIRDASNLALIMSGTGEAGRSSLGVTFTP